MSYMKTPSGSIMHVDVHQRAVSLAKQNGLNDVLLMLEPAEKVEVTFAVPAESPYRSIDVRGLPPSHWDFCEYLNDFMTKVYTRFGKKIVSEIHIDYEAGISLFCTVRGDGIGKDRVHVHTPCGLVTVVIDPLKKK